ncbi:RagB/SusD family nutrient uptake outer membrane protein, partial [Noviherbaspirillum sp. ST9]
KTGDRAIPFRADSLEVWYPYPTKWGGYDATDDFGYALVKDWPVMRLAETYLLRAEARFRRNNPAGAAEDINKLRDRAFKLARTTSGNADLGKVSASDITIDFILDERARELIAEENRRMTLVRMGKLKDRIAKNGDTSPVGKVITGFQDYNVLLPIPLEEIRLNKDAELTQNTGY